MKQISTKSFKTFILVGKNDEKEVRYYKVGYKGAHAYPRTVPLEKIYKIIDKSTLMHPKMIRNRMKYIDTEYINGNVLKKEDNPEIIKSLVCSFLYNLALIDCSSLKKYRIWSNNSEYLEYQVNNMLRIITPNKEIFEKVGLKESFFDKFKGVKLDDTRYQRLVHCNIEPSNVMYTNTDYYLIDWELANYGDLAYDVAMHIALTGYEEYEVDGIVKKIAASLGENPETLLRDVKIYLEFEDVRRAFTAINNVLGNIKRRTDKFDEIIERNMPYYNKLVPGVKKEDLIKVLILNGSGSENGQENNQEQQPEQKQE